VAQKHADPADPDPVPDPDPQHCCKAYDKNMEELARTVLASHLAAETGTSGSPPSFCVFFKTRNNNQVGRDDVVKLMATGTLMDGWHFWLVYGISPRIYSWYVFYNLSNFIIFYLILRPLQVNLLRLYYDDKIL
jgi:hypothetical protein